MSDRMRHPGPRAPERILAAPTRFQPLTGWLRRGQRVMDGVSAIVQESGFPGAVLWLDGLNLAPMRYVLPALSIDGLHGAWYSETHAPEGVSQIESATAMVGWREGAPFLHCHGIWKNADGSRAMGHLLPFDSCVAEDIEIRGIAALDARLHALPDPETAFTLFTPEALSPTTGTALWARILPGEDLITALETLAARHGVTEARLHGIGSIDHVVFEDGSRMDCLATELRLTDARLSKGRAEVAIDVVDIEGRIASGRLLRGANPIGVTLELFLQPETTS